MMEGLRCVGEGLTLESVVGRVVFLSDEETGGNFTKIVEGTTREDCLSILETPADSSQIFDISVCNDTRWKDSNCCRATFLLVE